jgi:hypothetical protein
VFGWAHRRPRPSAVADDVELRLIALLAIAERGCELQDRAEAVLRACATVEHPDPEVAREGGYIAGEYHRLHGWAVDAQRSGGGSTDTVDGLHRLVALLMMQHCMLVHHAVRLAFPKSGRHRPGPCPIAPELGDSARRLRASRTELARLLSRT